MAGRFVRASKFRHVFGSAGKKNELYDGIRVTKSAFDGAFCAVNPKFLAVCIDASGGGAFLILCLDRTGRQDVNAPRVCAHATDVLDLSWSPFDDNIIASCAEDGSIKIWQIPEKGLLTNLTESLLTFEYHQKRCTQVTWHPTASNILMSVSQDPSVIVWNLDDGSAVCEIDCHPDIVYNAAFNKNGSKVVSSCKDKKFRIIDARTGAVLVEGGGHEGAKPQRVIFIDDDRLFSTGFSKMSERQYAVWDLNALAEPLMIEHLDTANGALVPIFDADTQVLYIAAKGDSVIRYYEIVREDPFIHYISTFQSGDPQRGLSYMPKRGCNVHNNEIMRFFKIHGKGQVEPISFTVPRKSDLFQEDLYPDTASNEAALTAEEWQAGKNADPNLMSMKSLFQPKDGKVKAIKGLGGLKKGGLKKGLAAKKETKEPEPEPEKEKPKASPAPVSAPAPASTAPSKVSKISASHENAVSAKAPSSADAGSVKTLQDEIKQLKDSEKKLQSEVKSLKDQLKDHAKLQEEVKSLKEHVKKNDERITALEGLVQEETESEEEK